MSQVFDEKIQQTLGNAKLQLAIYTSTGRLIDHRRKSLTGQVPDFEDLRTHANAIKKHTIENLDYYLEQLEAMSRRMAARWCGAGTASRWRISCWPWQGSGARS